MRYKHRYLPTVPSPVPGSDTGNVLYCTVSARLYPSRRGGTGALLLSNPIQSNTTNHPNLEGGVLVLARGRNSIRDISITHQLTVDRP